MNIEWKYKETDLDRERLTGSYCPYYEGEPIWECMIDIRYVNNERAVINNVLAIVRGRVVYNGDDLTKAMLRVTRVISDLGLARNHTEDLIVQPYNFGLLTTRDIIGWKKAYANGSEVIVKLKIPRGAYLNATPVKWRASKAKVIAAYNINVALDGGVSLGDPIDETSIITPLVFHHNRLIYRRYPNSVSNYYVGNILEVNNFGDIGIECAPGIHFFRDLEHAFQFRFI